MVFIHQLLFFDENKEHIETYRKILGNILEKNLIFECIKFEDLIASQKIQIVVSPANSYLSMTGGIDKVYTDMFPGIEDKLRAKTVEKAYAKSGVVYKGTNFILPVGKAIICETGNSKCHFVMASPTMTTPKDINGTNNVYLCMKAILKKLSLINVCITIACPCLGTGIGNLSAKESAKQIKKALIKN